ncbi:MAG TPA: ABC transporter substrate-binding protein [Stellaceae bacterium]|nr:ABC transporter substrate-binding protein [Stellaceae bacterium]
MSSLVASLRRLAPVLLLALAPALPARADDAPSTLVLQLSGPAQFQYAGYFAALWKGFYNEAGLLVEIRPGSAPGQGNVDPAHEVAEGHAQFGVGSMSLVTRSAQGLPLLLLAPIFQSSGVMIFSRADSDFANPGALLKARVGRLPATDVLDLELVTALQGDGIDPDKLRSVPVEPGQAAAALADRSVDAVPASPWNFPWAAHARNLALKSFSPADYRVEFYGDTLFTLARFERANPELVKSFRAATLKGWAYALDHVDEISGRLLSDLPPPPGIADPAAYNKYQAEVAKALSRYPTVPFGHSSPERWSTIEASLASSGALVRVADPDSFVYDPDARAHWRIDWRDGVIAGLALLLAAAVAAAVQRRRRQPVPAAALSGTQTVVALPLPLPAPPPEIVAGIGADTKPPAPPRPPEKPVTSELNPVIAGLEAALRDKIPLGANFRLSLFPELWPCRTDGEAVAALVTDLVGAAAPDLRADDTLIVGTRNAVFDRVNVDEFPGARIGEFARVTIRDNGPGFTETQLERIFDPTASARQAVAASWPAMAKLGGYVRAESAQGVGTAIHLYFPRVAESSASARRADEPIAPPRRYRASGSRPTQRRSRSLR